MSEKHYVLSLGGSIIFPDEIDSPFISSFIELIKDHVKKGYKFVIITGGGKICRKYQAAAREINPSLSRDEEDWVGIHVTRMNAHFLRVLLGDMAFAEIVTDPEAVSDVSEPVILGAGWKPGWSTDYDTVHVAHTLGVSKIANLSNITHVYTADPKSNPDAQKREEMTWREYRSIIPSEWRPGLNLPFDPLAAAEAEKWQMEVSIMNGRDLENLKNYLEGDPFDGTLIHS